jgi:hypothetical protein
MDKEKLMALGPAKTTSLLARLHSFRKTRYLLYVYPMI